MSDEPKKVARYVAIWMLLTALSVASGILLAQTRATRLFSSTYGAFGPVGIALWTSPAAHGQHLWMFVDSDADPETAVNETLWDRPPVAIHFSEAPDRLRLCVVKASADRCATLGEFKAWLLP